MAKRSYETVTVTHAHWTLVDRGYNESITTLSILSFCSKGTPCKSALGVASTTTIPNNQMTASSWANLGTDNDFPPWRGRLGYPERCWCADTTQQNKNQWLQIDFLNAKKITGVATQSWWQRWVKTYYFRYSLDNTVWNQESGADKVTP